MKKVWIRLKGWLEEPRWGRKIVFNLCFTLILICLTWARLGCPMPTAELEFRRLEQINLLPPGEIVFTSGWESWAPLRMARMDGPVRALDGTELFLRGSWAASRGEDWAAIALVGGTYMDRFLRTYPLEPEGATLLNFYSGYGYWREETSQPGGQRETHNFFPLLLVDVPEETARAEVTVRKGGRSVTGPGWNMGNNVWLLTPDNQVLPYGQGYEEERYTLRLYRADGSLLLERSGTLEE